MTKPRKAPERCPQCRGAGTVPPADPKQTGRITCPTCGGSGSI